LRGDDGVGQAVVERLGAVIAPGTAELRAVYQLTPEMAEDFARVALVVVVDADADLAPGEVAVRDAAVALGSGEPFSHAVDPAGLAGLAHALYGASPRLVLVGIGPASLEAGEGVSPMVLAVLDGVVQTVAAMVRDA
jgi:hydrogenase maturation protease